MSDQSAGRALPPPAEYERAVRSLATELLVAAGEDPVPADISLAGISLADSRAAGMTVPTTALDLVGRVRQSRCTTEPTFQRGPYDRQEARVAEYLAGTGGIGGAMDPVGLLIALRRFGQHGPGPDEDRVSELALAVSALRHDLRGLLSPAMLMADMLVGHADPMVAQAASRIMVSLDRTIERLNQTYDVVPSRDATAASGRNARWRNLE